MDLGLRNKVALVTGSSRGLGRAVCLALAAEGASVVVNCRQDANNASALVNEIRHSFEVGAVRVQGDVSVESDVIDMFNAAENKLAPVDILVNNAAICPTCQVRDMTHEQWVDTVAVNLNGTFLTSREMVRRLIAEDRVGRIVNVASTAAFLGSTTGHAPYDASKGGVVSFTLSLAREVAQHGIAVNAIAPGMILTEMTAATLKANKAKYLARIPLNRIADPREIADVILFLASERSSYMTGTTVNVSGGLLMG